MHSDFQYVLDHTEAAIGILKETNNAHQPSSVKDLVDALPNSVYHGISRYTLIVAAAKLIREGKICKVYDKTDDKQYKKEYRRS